MDFFPHNFVIPTTLSADAAIVSAQDLVYALQHPKLATTFATAQSDQAAALATLSEKFLRRAQSAPRPSFVLTLRVRALTVTPIIPPRVLVTPPEPQLPSLAPAACQRPFIIKPDEDNPSLISEREGAWQD